MRLDVFVILHVSLARSAPKKNRGCFVFGCVNILKFVVANLEVEYSVDGRKLQSDFLQQVLLLN